MRIILVCLLAGAALVSPATAGPAFLVKDINTTPVDPGSDPRDFVESGGRVYFVARSDEYGTELWASDGTESGTVLVKDICRGRCGSSPIRLTAGGGGLFFFADDGRSGLELWVSDGTSAGTRKVREICPGDCDGVLRWNLVTVGGAVYFVGQDPASGAELWRSDGTSEGTRRVADICRGPCSSATQMLSAFAGKLFFSAHVPDTGQELWMSDGTPEGTSLFADVRPGESSSAPRNLTIFGEGLYFAATGDQGFVWWKSDGTPGDPTPIRVLDPSLIRTYQVQTAELDDRLYFFGTDRVFKTDGTAAGTREAVELYPDASGRPVRLYADGDRLYFVLVQADSREELWLTDGTLSGSRRLVDGLTDFVTFLASAGGKTFFSASQDSSAPRGLWVSDGTSDGTFALGGLLSGHHSAVPFGGEVHLSADDGLIGREVWASDGTEAGTRLVRNVRPARSDSLRHYTELHEHGGEVFFNANDSANDNAIDSLWRSDGTETGTEVLSPEAAILAESAGPRLFFVGRDLSLWVSDGTNVTQIDDVELVDELASMGETLYFSAGAQGQELWAHDGTRSELIVDVHPEWVQGCLVDPPNPIDCHSQLPAFLTVVENELFFIASEDGVSPQLWVSDGTAAASRVLKTFDTGTEGLRRIFLQELFDVAGRLFFTAFETDTGWGLWTSDGTEAGTFLLKDVASDPRRPGVSDLRPFGDSVVFPVRHSDRDELWMSDGTADGTVLVSELALGALPSRIVEIDAYEERVFLSVFNAALGTELWVSDGTSAGTSPLIDLLPGAEGSEPRELTVVDGNLLFVADDGVHGGEPWWSDGTAAGTLRLDDLDPGTPSSGSKSFTAAGSLVYFTADDGSGRELWAVDRALLEEWRTRRFTSVLSGRKKPK